MTNNSKLFIGNLPSEVDENCLKELIKDKSGSLPLSVLIKQAGYAFVECIDQATAQRAITSLNGFSFMGSELLVEPSVPMNRR
ncbi:uncharacterized protein CDAR_300391, partial [Caerostris darwini]